MAVEQVQARLHRQPKREKATAHAHGPIPTGLCHRGVLSSGRGVVVGAPRKHLPAEGSAYSLIRSKEPSPILLHGAYYVKDRDSKQAIGMVTHVCRYVTISAKRARVDQHAALSDQGNHPPYYCRVLTTWKPGLAGHRYSKAGTLPYLQGVRSSASPELLESMGQGQLVAFAVQYGASQSSAFLIEPPLALSYANKSIPATPCKCKCGVDFIILESRLGVPPAPKAQNTSQIQIVRHV